MANSKAIGETTEAVILAHLIQRGDSVSLPFGNNQRYDMIVDRRGQLIRAQCKTGRLRNGVVLFNACSFNGFTGAERDYRGQADVFLVWCQELRTVYELPVEACGKRMVALRVNPSRNGQSARTRIAAAYQLRCPSLDSNQDPSRYERAAPTIELLGRSLNANA